MRLTYIALFYSYTFHPYTIFSLLFCRKRLIVRYYIFYFQNEQSSTEDTAFKKTDKKDTKEGTATTAGTSKDDKNKSE